MNCISLFAGVGGIDIGMDRIGVSTVAYSEVEAFGCAALARHYPDARPLGDVSTIDWDQHHDLHDIQFIVGGFPCQDISLAGRGGGSGRRRTQRPVARVRPRHSPRSAPNRHRGKRRSPAKQRT